MSRDAKKMMVIMLATFVVAMLAVAGIEYVRYELSDVSFVPHVPVPNVR